MPQQDASMGLNLPKSMKKQISVLDEVGPYINLVVYLIKGSVQLDEV